MAERKTIYLCLAHMSEEGIEQKYVKEAFDTNWVVPLGPNVNAFEEDLKRFVGGKNEVVALSAGTAAVHLALLACGVGPGDEVLVQSFTFCASSHPITYLGATPVFVDSEVDTWNMDPDLLEEAIKVCGTFGHYGVLSFNGNKMITTSGGGALICPNEEAKRKIMFYATQARESYPYYQHEEIGYNYRMSNVCAGIGRGQMTVLDEHIAHHKHIQSLYRTMLKDVDGITLHENPDGRYDSNFWLCTITLFPELHVEGEEHVYETAIQGAVGGAAGIVHQASSLHTNCEPNKNVEGLRIALDKAGIESRPLWKPMHLQPVYEMNPSYTNGVSESLFTQGLCLPSGPCVTDEDVAYIVAEIKNCIKN